MINKCSLSFRNGEGECLKEESGLDNFLFLKRDGLVERRALMEDFTVSIVCCASNNRAFVSRVIVRLQKR